MPMAGIWRRKSGITCITPTNVMRVARAAHQRVRREHLYEIRFESILEHAIARVGDRRNQAVGASMPDLLMNPWQTTGAALHCGGRIEGLRERCPSGS